MATQSNPLISLRSLARLAPELSEPVDVTHRVRGDDAARVIGTYIPAATAPRAAQDRDGLVLHVAEASPPEPSGSGGRTSIPGPPGAPDPAARHPTRSPASPREAQAARDKVLKRIVKP